MAASGGSTRSSSEARGAAAIEGTKRTLVNCSRTELAPVQARSPMLQLVQACSRVGSQRVKRCARAACVMYLKAQDTWTAALIREETNMSIKISMLAEALLDIFASILSRQTRSPARSPLIRPRATGPQRQSKEY